MTLKYTNVNVISIIPKNIDIPIEEEEEEE
jgi:hypothetical protein